MTRRARAASTASFVTSRNHAPAVLVDQILLTDLQASLATGEKNIARAKQRGGCDGVPSAQALQILATEEFPNDGHLALG